jgi:cbb3-type cytochrome oxidase maturation protein
MGVIVLLILASLTMAVVFLGAFIWSVRAGQFEDTTTPAMRVLLDDVESAEVRSPKSGVRNPKEV